MVIWVIMLLMYHSNSVFGFHIPTSDITIRTGTFAILGFQWTHASDLSHVVIGEIKDTTCETPEYTGKQKLIKM